MDVPPLVEAPWGPSSETLYDRNFVLAFASTVFFVMANGMLVHFARFITFLDGDERDIGWIMGIGPIAAIAIRPWLGRWIDLLGPRRVWAAGCALFALTNLGYVFIHDLGPAIYILRGLGIIAPAMIFTSSFAYLNHIAPPGRLAEAIGMIGIGGFLGIACGPAIGDFFLNGSQRDAQAFVNLFATAAGLVLIGLVLLRWMKPVPPHPDAGGTPFLASLRDHWPGAILLVCATFGLCMAVPFGFLAEMADRRDIPNVGRFFVVYGLWATVVRLACRRLDQRIGRRPMMLAGMAFMAMGMVNYLFVTDFVTLLIPALLCSTAHALTFHTMTSLAVDRFPPAARGLGMALALMALDSGMVFGAPIIGQIAYHFGYNAMFLTIALTILVVCGFYVACAWRTSSLRSAYPARLR